MNITSLLDLAEIAARAAGDAIGDELAPSNADDLHASSPPDLRAASAIEAVLSKAGLPVFNEEAGRDGFGEYDLSWVVDPLDGSINANVGAPDYSVSIALVDRLGEPLAAVVSAPRHSMILRAHAGSGMWLNGVPFNTPKTPAKVRVLAFGVPDDGEIDPQSHSRIVEECARHRIITRQGGSATLDIARTALGVWDAFYEDGLYLWDFAAAQLLVTEAGGQFWRRALSRPSRNGCRKYEIAALAPSRFWSPVLSFFPGQ